MNNFLIRIIDRKLRKEFGMLSAIGEIKIKTFFETFHMPIEWWSLEQYQQQWKEGLERLKDYNRSCLVATIQDPTKAPLINMWVLYKEKETVYIQNFLLHGKQLAKDLKKRPFTRETCYDFIGPRATVASDGITKVSEWTVKLDDILDLIKEPL